MASVPTAQTALYTVPLFVVVVTIVSVKKDKRSALILDVYVSFRATELGKRYKWHNT